MKKVSKNKQPRKSTIVDFGSDSDFETPKIPSPNTSIVCVKENEKVVDLTSTLTRDTVCIPQYALEIAKSGRAECRRCGEKIPMQQLRVGVITEGDWGLFTKWQHLACTIFHPTIKIAEAIDGYAELTNLDKMLVKERIEKSQSEIDYDYVAVNPDELVRKEWSVSVEPVDELLMPLLPYQKEGLAWMIHQENESNAHGGILADEMGMGKTIEAISLILSNPASNAKQSHIDEWTKLSKTHVKGTTPLINTKATLIIVPTIAIFQWRNEILRFTRTNSLNIAIYHGSTRNITPKNIQDIDVVITSYAIIETEYRKATAGNKITCTICKKKFYAEKFRMHRKYFCGDNARKTSAQMKTERKSQLLQDTDVSRSESDSDFSESEEIDKQKRLIKAQKEKETMQKNTKVSKAKGKVTANAITKDDLIDVQRSASTKKSVLKVTKKSNGKIDSKKKMDSSEDEIDKQKRVIQAQKDREMELAMKGTKPSATKSKALTVKAINKAGGSGNKPGVQKGRASVCNISESSEDEVFKIGSKNANKRKVHSDSDNDDMADKVDKRGPKARTAKTTKTTKAAVAKRAKMTESVPRRHPSSISDDSQSISSNDDDDDDDDDHGDVKITARKPSPKKPSRPSKEKIKETSKGKSKPKLGSKRGRDCKSNLKDELSGSESSFVISDSDDAKLSESDDSIGDSYSSDSVSMIAGSKGKKIQRTIMKVNSKSKAMNKKSLSIYDSSDDDKSLKRGGQGKGKARKAAKKENAKDEEDGDGEDSEVERIIRSSTKHSKAVSTSMLHLFSWFRVILDEAHMIKDRSSSTCKAVFNLVSLNKWCLTGTPLQNRVSELYSLIRFLQLDPHAYYYCKSKNCNCRSLHYRFTNGKCDDCQHTAMLHYSHFNKHILNPIKRSGYVADGKKAMLVLKNEVLDKILLRRTKTSRAEDIQLPPRLVKIRLDNLDVQENDFYQALYTQSQSQYNTYVQKGTVLNNYAHIFDILIRLRQAVDHPYLVIHSESVNNKMIMNNMEIDNNRNAAANMLSGKEDEEIIDEANTIEEICGFCHEPATSPCTSSNCIHVFCQSCVLEYINCLTAVTNEVPVMHEASSGSAADVTKNSKKKRKTENNEKPAVELVSSHMRMTPQEAKCPQCDKLLNVLLNQDSSTVLKSGTNDVEGESSYEHTQSLRVAPHRKLLKKSIIHKIDINGFQTSTKLEALMQELYTMQQKDFGAKAIVFSQFVNMLDLIEHRINMDGIKCCKLLGSLQVDQREQIIKGFNTDPDIKVLLISLKAGGVALNLTIANYIFLMDPWWNPASEMQAIDRTHRIGQHKPIFATRFIIENTVEERILQLQEKKRLVFDSTIGGDAASMARLTPDDIKFLFQ